MERRNHLNVLFCEYACSQKSSLNKYTASVHEGKKPFKCQICDFNCSYTEEEENSQMWCMWIQLLSQGLNDYLFTVNEMKKPFICGSCEVTFSREVNLKRHIALVHDGKKPFNCHICDTTFTQNLNEILTHYFNFGKVRTFWKGHKKLKQSPTWFDIS